MKIYIIFYRIFYKIKKSSYKVFRIFYYMKIEFYIIYIYFDIIDEISRNIENRISDKMKKGLEVETRISGMFYVVVSTRNLRVIQNLEFRDMKFKSIQSSNLYNNLFSLILINLLVFFLSLFLFYFLIPSPPPVYMEREGDRY